MKCDLLETIVNLNPLGMETLLWQSRGDIPLIDPHDMAYLMSRIRTPGAGYLLRVKYGGQMGCLIDLEYALYHRVLKIATNQKWKTPKEYIGTEPFRKACRLAIWENINPHICPVCLGRAEARIENKVVQCGECHGSGRVSIDDDFRQRVLEITDWPDYMRRYRRIQMILYAWEKDGRAGMSEALYGT